MKITFARFGNYTPCIKNLLKNLGFEVVLPEKTSSKTIIEGAKISPEMFCFPFKVNMGNYLSAIEMGSEMIFMVTASFGSCRLRYYGDVSEKILKDKGFKVDFFIFDQSPKDIFLKIKKLSGASFLKILKSILFFFKQIKFVEQLEKKAHFLRPREIKKGSIDQVLEKAIFDLEKIEKEKEFYKFKREILNLVSQIEFENKNVPQVGIVGEIYTVCDPQVNFHVEKKLGRLGIQVQREMTLSYHLTKKIYFKDFFIQKKIKPYLASTVGGHGRDAIYEMLNFVKKGLDGIIQLLPMGCMPEVSVRPILEKIHHQTQIPFLSLSFDEEVGEAGIDTRLEAFSDVVKNYFKKKLMV